MVVYLLHGFRWPRSAIRLYIEIQDIEDAAADYICSPITSAAIHASFCSLYPKIMSSLPSLRLIEQYSPEFVTENSIQPFAFVADKIETCQLNIDVGVTTGQDIGTEEIEALAELRDKLAPVEKIGWWVVYNADENRLFQESGETIGAALNTVYLYISRASMDC